MIRLRVFVLTVATLGLHAVSLAQYDAKAAEPIHKFAGTIFVGGGGELPGEAFDAFVQMAGGSDAKLVVLSCGSIDASVKAPFVARDLNSISMAQDAKTATAALKEANAAWLTGDDAAKFATAFRGTEVEFALRALVARGGVIGANGEVSRAMTKVMIRSGQPHAAVDTGLDLLPGAVLDDSYSTKNRKNRLLGVLAAQPELVGLGVDQKTAMIVHQRFIDVLGSGNAHACLSASTKRPLRIDRMNRRESPASQRRRPVADSPRTGRRGFRRGSRPGRRGGAARAFRPRRLGDLIALGRAAQARAAQRFPAWRPEPPNVEKGTLIIIGGGGMPKGLMDRFIELAGGKEKAHLLYVPCTEEEKVGREPGIVRMWRRAGITTADWIHTKDRDAANTDEKILGKLRRATGIFFGGGRQWNLVDSWQNTTAHKLMHEVLARGGVIGGSSAGASIQAGYMVRGNSLGNLDPMAEGYETGLGFVTGIAVDQHFAQRGRRPDMTVLVNTYPELLGIGLDEASSIIVRGSIAEAFSRQGRNVHVYDRTKPVVPGKPDYILLTHGQKYDLKKRSRVEAAVKRSEPAKAGVKK